VLGSWTLDQDLDVDPHLELDGDVDVDPIVDVDLAPRSTIARRAFRDRDRKVDVQGRGWTLRLRCRPGRCLGSTSTTTSTSTSSDDVPAFDRQIFKGFDQRSCFCQA